MCVCVWDDMKKGRKKMSDNGGGKEVTQDDTKVVVTFDRLALELLRQLLNVICHLEVLQRRWCWRLNSSDISKIL